MVKKSMAEDQHVGGTRWFDCKATEVAFPLGGIGTGNISLGARGDLRDFEIWNEPRKGVVLPFTNFVLWAREEGKPAISRVLEGQIPPPYSASHGIHPNHFGGLPRFLTSRFRGQYPVAELELDDSEVPLDVALLTYTPLVPLDADDSGLPCVVFRWRLHNRSAHAVEATVVGSMLNPIGYTGLDNFGNVARNPYGEPVNRWEQDDLLRGVYFEGPAVPPTDLHFGNAALTTVETDTTAKPTWQRGGWYDALREFWEGLADDGRLTIPPASAGQTEVGPERTNVHPGSVGVPIRLEPGESRTVTFLLSWYMPNRVNGWDAANPGQPPTRRIRYAGRFESAWAVARYAATHLDRLHASTLAFRDAVFQSTLPPVVVDAMAGTLVVARSNTCFWLEDGRFFGWEGCFDHGGSCHGSCTHVWNYAQSLAFMFPSLESSMLRTSYLDEVEDSGKMRFRTETAFGGRFDMPLAAADGQLGMVIRVWRTFTLTGDRSLLADLWPAIQKTLQYALATWDHDGDGVLEGQQHNTYDIEFYGPSPLTNVLLLGALRAAAAIADRVGDTTVRDHYQVVEALSAIRIDAMLWNGEYYRQILEGVDAHAYQHGDGCLSDQLLGQLLAHVAGLGHVLPAAHVHDALEAIYRYNFRRPLATHVNLQRTYALPDESGLLLCSWPLGGQPRLPFVYSDEVWSGTEYQVAANLMYEGEVEQGLDLVTAVRARYDGLRRNPWNEVECGHHYARSMASWALLVALSGFRCDMDARSLTFSPVQSDAASEVRLPFTCGAGWGIYRQTVVDGIVWPALTVLGGTLDGFQVCVGPKVWKVAGGALVNLT